MMLKGSGTVNTMFVEQNQEQDHAVPKNGHGRNHGLDRHQKRRDWVGASEWAGRVGSGPIHPE